LSSGPSWAWSPRRLGRGAHRLTMWRSFTADERTCQTTSRQRPPAWPRLYPKEVLQWDARMAWSCTPLRPGSCSITLSRNAFGDFASRG
jgi:hypothetical protein